jgi:hypothetical protein
LRAVGGVSGEPLAQELAQIRPVSATNGKAGTADQLDHRFRSGRNIFTEFGTVFCRRSGPGNLNSPIRVETAPDGEDLASKDWSKYEQKTPPHALSGIQG